MAWIEGRGINPELATRLGLDTTRDDGGSYLSVPYRDAGRVVNHKHRAPGKRFKMDIGAPLILWNRDVLTDDALSSHPLIVTEGEWDALAAMSAGKQRVVSVPNGAPGPHEDSAAGLASEREGKRYAYLWRDKAFLDTVDSIILAVDNDAPGLKLAADLARWFGPERCRFVEYPEGCKDLNDVLVKFDEPTVVRLLDAAKPYPIKGLHRFSSYPEPPEYERISTGISVLDELIEFVPGTLTIWTGYAGEGKSSLMLNVLASAIRNGHNVALASFETAVKPILQRKMRAALARCPEYKIASDVCAEADEILEERLSIISHDVDDDADDMTLEGLIELGTLAVVRDFVRIVVIDPWNELEHARGKDESETDYTARAIKRLKRFARAYQVAVIVVAHPAKPDTTAGKLRPPGLYNISGSAAWANKADYGLVVHRPDKATDNADVYVTKVRMGLPGKQGKVTLAYNWRESTYTRFINPLDPDARL